MKNVLFVTTVSLALAILGCEKSQEKPSQGHATLEKPAAPSGQPGHGGEVIELGTTEAGCATCIYKMHGVTGCKLAVKIDGKPYLVQGVEMDALGDAHAADGLCNRARRALAQGKIEGGMFVASSIELIPN